MASIDFESGNVEKGMTGGTGLLDLKNAEEIRLNTTIEQQKNIQRLYKKLAKEARRQANALKGKSNVSDALRKSYLNNLSKQLTQASDSIGKEIEASIRGAIETTAQGVVTDQRAFLKKIGMPNISSAFSHVPRDIVEAVANGGIYKGDWSLSKAIWGMSKKTSDDINTIIAEGIAQNKSTYDIAKDLEKYVSPTAKKPFDWGKVYPGTAKQIDYNAQRLSRTLVSHAYQQSLVNTCSKNPFVTGFKWRSAHTHRTCEICNERDGTVYPKDDLPLDHPNGICTFIAVIPESSDDIVDRLASWVNGTPDSALDSFAADIFKRHMK